MSINDVNLVPEIPVPNVVQLLFGRPNIDTTMLERNLIALRESHGIDHIISVPVYNQNATIRFWLYRKEKLMLNEVNNA